MSIDLNLEKKIVSILAPFLKNHFTAKHFRHITTGKDITKYTILLNRERSEMNKKNYK